MKTSAYRITAAFGLLLLGVLTQNSSAQTAIPVPNFSFENDTNGVPDTTGSNFFVDSNGAGVSNFTYVDAHGASGTLVASNTYGSTGARYAFLNIDDLGAAQSGNPYTGTITSNGSLATIEADTTYSLTVAVGNPPSSDSSNFGSPGTVTLSLLGNGALASSTTVTTSQTTDGAFEDFTTSFTTGNSGGFIGDALSLQLAATQVGNYATQPGFDNLRLTETAVPEPSIWAMIIGGGLLIGLYSRRRLNEIAN